jgi:uncharacterized protein (DUF2062 family)
MIAPLRRAVDAVTTLLRQGTSPSDLARAIALAVVLGVFPVLGATTLLCAGAAALLRLNLPLMQLVNWLIYPVQIALLIPLMSLGTRLFGASPLPTLAQLMQLVAADPLGAIRLFWPAGLSAIGAWLVLAPFAAIVIYAAVLLTLRGLALRTPRRAE